MSQQESDLNLLDQVELRLGLAATESQFEAQLMALLVPVLLKLDSEFPNVKQKVMSICSHVNKRFKSSSEIKLPVEKLVELFISPSTGNTAKSFCLIYLEMAFSRCSNDLARVLVPQLLKNIAQRPQAQQMVLFAIVLPRFSLFIEQAVPVNDPFGWNQSPADLLFIISKFQDVLLYTVPSSGRQLTALNAASNAALPALNPIDNLPTGLSRNAVNFITNKLKAPWTMSHSLVKELKIQLLKFVLTEKLVPKESLLAEKYLLNLIAVQDSAHEVQFIGDGGLKRLAKPDFEEKSFILRLYSIYQGSQTAENDDNYRSPALPIMKQKIIETLSKSAAAANQLPQMIQVAFDALYGQEKLPKLRALGMSFVQWIARMSRPEVLKPVCPVLLSGLLKVIDEPATTSNESLRAFAYEAVGLLSKKAPELFDTDILVNFFSAVSSESTNVRVSIQDALTTMAPAYKARAGNQDFTNRLRSVLLENIDKPEPSARFAAVKYATSLFKFSDPFARCICLIAASDTKLVVKEEALKGLKFPGKAVISEEDNAAPALLDMIQCLEEFSKKVRYNIVKAPGTQWVGNLTAETFQFTILFLYQILIKSVDPDHELEGITVMAEEKPQWPSITLSAKLKDGLELMLSDGNGCLESFIRWLERPLTTIDGDGKLQTISCHFLVLLISLSPISVANSFSSKKDWIVSFLYAQKLDTKISMARLLGIVFAANLGDASSKSQFDDLLQSLVKQLESSTDIDEKQGSLLGLGFLLGQVCFHHKSTRDYLPESTFALVLGHVSKIITESSQFDLLLAACYSMSEISRYGQFEEAYLVQDSPIRKTIEKLKTLIKSPKEAKIQEIAVAAIGNLAVSNNALQKDIFDFVLTLPNDIPKQAELHFNIGESLCACLFGFGSSHLHEYLDIPNSNYAPLAKNASFAQESLQKILGLITPTQNAVTKKAGCIWLLCLTKFCGKDESVKTQLLKFHAAFSGLLGDKDDFTQEVASKGIGLIYDIGDQALKNELVQNLVSTFTDGKKIAAQSVTNDTQLFSGDIGSTPDGGNLNTYQSILSLAADMNQPDLVYKFMSLASHHAVWNSRRGASMGFGSIAAQAEKELERYLPKLVPRLYRYQFDPHPKTAQGMKNIWRSLVKDPVKSVNEFFAEIMSDILKGMGDRMWRTRESCCAALADLLHGRQLEQLQPFMTELWNMCFRTLDDIKESVRKAAFLTCKSLTNLTVRYANPTYFDPSKSQKVMDDMIPFLLEKGFVNSAEEVRQFSLATILKLCKTGGILLKPHVTVIICTFLESLSILEPQAMNYISLNADKYNISQDMLDASRLSAAKTSPVMDALDQCVQYVDSEILKELVPKVCVIIRKGVGLPTRAGTARFIYTLVNRFPRDLGDHADSLLKALSGAIFDRSAVIRKSFSTATGYVCKVASSNSVEKLALHLKTSYLDANDEEGRSIAPITFLEISRHAPNAAVDVHYIILPLAFMGSRDTIYPSLADIWSKVWEENTGGSTNAIKKWKKELLESLITVLGTSQSWELKKQVGKGLVDFQKALGNDIVSLIPSLLPLIVDSLSGRTWDGKESILEALSTLAVEGKAYFETNAADKKQIEDVLIREAKKNNKAYKRVGLDYLGKALDALKSDRFSDVYDYLVETADGVEEEDDDDETLQKPLVLSIRANAFKAIGNCFPANPSLQSAYADKVGVYLGNNLVNQVWNIRIAILESVQTFLNKNKTTPSSDSILVLVTGIMSCLNDLKYRAIREAGANCLKSLLDAINGISKLESDTLISLEQIANNERDSAIQDALKKMLKK